MTIPTIERNAAATAAQFSNFAMRQLLQPRKRHDPQRALLECIKDCCASVPSVEESRSITAEELLIVYEGRSDALLQLTAMLFAVETDRIFPADRPLKELDEQRRSRILSSQARRAMEVFGMIPDLPHEQWQRFHRALGSAHPNAFLKVMEVLLRKIAEHWALGVAEDDARFSLKFLIDLARPNQSEHVRSRAIAALRDADSHAPVTRIAQAVILVKASFPDYSESRAIILRNLALAIGRNASQLEIERMALAFTK